MFLAKIECLINYHFEYLPKRDSVVIGILIAGIYDNIVSTDISLNKIVVIDHDHMRVSIVLGGIDETTKVKFYLHLITVRTPCLSHLVLQVTATTEANGGIGQFVQPKRRKSRTTSF